MLVEYHGTQTVVVFGLGHVGLVTAVMLARRGHWVTGVDVDAARVAQIARDEVPFREPLLVEYLHEELARGTLSVTTNARLAVEESGVALVCVGTPMGEDGEPDLQAVAQVLREIGLALRAVDSFYVVVLRSTVPPTALDELGVILESASGKRLDKDFGFCTWPEFLREGSAIHDFESPPFMVIGRRELKSAGLVAGLQGTWATERVLVDLGTAMLVKYVSNAWHALKVTFANEVGDIATRLGLDAQEVMRVFVQDRVLNISALYLRPGAPFGGSCLPKDVAALTRMTGMLTPVLDAITESNQTRIKCLVGRVLGMGWERIGVLGLSFKHGTDDLRDSPGVQVVDTLMELGIEYGFEVWVYDPDVQDVPGLVADLDSLVAWAEGLVMVKAFTLPEDCELPVVTWGASS